MNISNDGEMNEEVNNIRGEARKAAGGLQKGMEGKEIAVGSKRWDV